MLSWENNFRTKTVITAVLLVKANIAPVTMMSEMLTTFLKYAYILYPVQTELTSN